MGTLLDSVVNEWANLSESNCVRLSERYSSLLTPLILHYRVRFCRRKRTLTCYYIVSISILRLHQQRGRKCI